MQPLRANLGSALVLWIMEVDDLGYTVEVPPELVHIVDLCSWHQVPVHGNPVEVI